MIHSSSQTEPLKAVWWQTDARPCEVPAKDESLLGPYDPKRPGYELVRLGYELVRLGSDSAEAGGEFAWVCLWNVLHKTDDPALSDEEKRRINAMQSALGPVSDEDRYIRLQIACLERCYWTFPRNVDLILDGIVSGKVNLDGGVSCLPPWSGMLDTLRMRRGHPRGKWKIRLHHQQDCDLPEDPRQELLQAYITVLNCWCVEAQPNSLKERLPDRDQLIDTIYRRLGPPTTLKWLFLRKLILNLAFWTSASLTDEDDRRKRVAESEDVIDKAILGKLGGAEDTITPLIQQNNNYGTCHHSFLRHVDHQIAAIGAGGPVQLPGSGEERKRIYATITDYVHVLGSWLAKREQDEAVRIWPSCEEIARRVYRELGEPTPRKRWLVASLWKHLRTALGAFGQDALDKGPNRFGIPAEALGIEPTA